MPKIMLYTPSTSYSCLLMPTQLKEAGFQLAACGAENHPFRVSRYLDHYFTLEKPLASESLNPFIKYCFDWQPDIILPTDEFAIKNLHSILRHASLQQPNTTLTGFLALVRAAVGRFSPLDHPQPRVDILGYAKKLQIATPEFFQVNQWKEAEAAARQTGFPVVLKREWSCSGLGVRICHDLEEFQRAYQELDANRHPDHPLLLQRFIRGKLIMLAMAVWQGKVMANLAAWQEVIRGSQPTGPSRVIRFTEAPQLGQLAQTLLAESGFNGFAGLDFMVEEGTNRLFFLEWNGRWIQAGGFGSRLGIPFGKALWEGIHGRPFSPASDSPIYPVVGLFPYQWLEAPGSPLLQNGQCDVPWQDPYLLAAVIREIMEKDPLSPLT